MKKFVQTTILSFIAAMAVSCSSGANNVTQAQRFTILKDQYFVKNNFSEYKIVIPSRQMERVQMAANEIQSFISEAADCFIPVINETEVKRTDKIISLGPTTQFNETFEDFDLSPLNLTISSFFMSTRDNNIYIYSNPTDNGHGVLYGAYQMLEDMIDYKFYMQDEIYYKEVNDINLLQYNDWFTKPSFDGRAIGNYTNSFDNTICNRYRLFNQYRGDEWADLYGHSQMGKFVKPNDPDPKNPSQTLVKSHRDWFMSNMAQLCWSAGEELERYVADRFIYFIQKYPKATYFMFGQEDNKYSCDCDRCLAKQENECLNAAGLQVAFMNNVINLVEQWIAENDPTREIKYVVFGYYATKEPPVVLNAQGQYVPYTNSVIPHKKLYIFYAPIECNFAVPLNSPINKELYDILQGWNAITKNTMMYLYDVNFHDYFINFNNFSTAKEMYQTCQDNGVAYMYTQGAMDSYVSGLDDMRNYVESNLMWDLSKDYDTLARDFMDHFYKDGSDDMWEYYTLYKDAYARYMAANVGQGGIYGHVTNGELFPYALVRRFDKCIHDAMTKISDYEFTNPALYKTLKDRIMKEYLLVIYLKIVLWKDNYTESERREMKEIFQYYTSYYNITRLCEGGSGVDLNW